MRTHGSEFIEKARDNIETGLLTKTETECRRKEGLAAVRRLLVAIESTRNVGDLAKKTAFSMVRRFGIVNDHNAQLYEHLRGLIFRNRGMMAPASDEHGERQDALLSRVVISAVGP
jgi:hypothetical protein